VKPILFGLAFSALLACFPNASQAQEGPAAEARGENRPGGGQSRVQRGREFLGLGPPADPEAAKRGQEVFVRNCGFCHGANANGAEGPNLVRSTIVLHDEKGELIGPVVLKGRPDKGMPAFASLTQAQIYDISQFLRARVEAAANRYTYKMQDIVTGNAGAGEAYFNGAGRCKTCHSVTGDLAHIGSKFQPTALQARFLFPAGSSPGGESAKSADGPKVKLALKSGETVTGRLKRLDDFDVSIYDSAGNYQSYAVSEVKIEVEDQLATHRELLSKYTDADMHNLLAYLVTLK
jgi:cytochrome c oxidase cbb3-type subunit 3